MTVTAFGSVQRSENSHQPTTDTDTDTAFGSFQRLAIGNQPKTDIESEEPSYGRY